MPLDAALTSVEFSPKKVAAFIHCECPLIRVASDLPVLISQNRTVPSALALASILPSGEKVRAVTPLRCPANAASSLPVVVSDKSTVLSVLPLASIFPSGENANTFTQPSWC